MSYTVPLNVTFHGAPSCHFATNTRFPTVPAAISVTIVCEASPFLYHPTNVYASSGSVRFGRVTLSLTVYVPSGTGPPIYVSYLILYTIGVSFEIIVIGFFTTVVPSTSTKLPSLSVYPKLPLSYPAAGVYPSMADLSAALS